MSMSEPFKEMTDVPSPEMAATRAATHIVGIGVSSETFTQLQTFLRYLPINTGFAFVVIPKQSQEQTQPWRELLARDTSLPILEVAALTVLQADTIYLIPAAHRAIMENGCLVIQTSRSPPLSTPVDEFFHSLAHDRRDRTVAVLLSDHGIDGNNGALAVHSAGGVVLSQPNQATAAQCPFLLDITDLIAPPEALGEFLGQYSQHEQQNTGAGKSGFLMLDNALNNTFRLMRETYNVDFHHYRETTLLRRVERRAHLGNHESVTRYLNEVQNNQAECEALYRDLLIGVTAFYRDVEAYAILRDSVIPELLATRRHQDEIRVWVAGCSTGEEAYTLATVFLEAMSAPDQKRLRIFATDINQSSLEHAGNAVYAASSLNALPPALMQKYFEPSGSDSYKAGSALRNCMSFSAHNLLDDAPFHHIDFISCRNLMIYLNGAAQKKVLHSLHFALKLNGILMLGPSETPGDLENDFVALNTQWRLYKKVAHTRQKLNLGMDRLARLKMDGGSNDSRMNRIYDILLGRHIPPGVLIDEKRQVLHLFGNANRFLHPPAGRVNNELTGMVSENLRSIFSSIIHSSFANNQSVTLKNLKLDDTCQADVMSSLITDPVSKARYLLLTISDHVPASVLAEDSVPLSNVKLDNEIRSLVHSLEKELADTRLSLQTMMVEMESTNEELQASNEELVAANEAMQSANEELHSVNEELHSVNTELQDKIRQYDQSTADIRNLVAISNTGIIFTDELLNLRLYTPLVTRLLNILPQDVGRPISHITSLVNEDDLLGALEEIRASGHTPERVIHAPSGELLLRRISRYEGKDSTQSGFVITYNDITEIANSREEALLREKRLVDITNAIPLMLFTSDPQGNYTYANQNFLEYTGLSLQQALGGDNPSLIHPADQEQAKADWANTLNHTPVDAVHRVRRHDGAYRWFHVRAEPMRDNSGDIYQWLGTFTDVHDSKNAYDQLNHMVQSAPIAIITFDDTGLIRQVNKQTPLWFGYTEQELLGRDVAILFSSTEDRSYMHFLQEYMANPGTRVMGQIRTLEGLRRGGEPFPIEVGLNPINILGKLHVVAFITDNTLRVRAEQSLRVVNESLEQAIAQRSRELLESQKRLELAARVSAIGIFDWDMKTKQVTYNQNMFEIMGIPPTQDMTINYEIWRSCLIEEDWLIQEKIFQDAQQNLRTDISSVYRIRRYDTGELRFISSNRSPVYDERGEPCRIVGVVRDITETKQTELALRETTQWLEEKIRQRTQELTTSEQRFRQMADASPVLFWLSDARGNLGWVNKTWETWTGRSLQDELAGDWMQHIHADDREQVKEALAAHIRNTERFSLEYRLRNAQGTYGWIYHQCSPMLSSEGRVDGFLATCTDITWQKVRTEEQQRIERKLEATAKLDSLGLMAGGVAHDFNNLLTGILGNIELAQWETTAEQSMLKTVLADARTATLRAADLCKQMLAYSGKGQFTSDDCDLNDLTQETLRFISASIKPGVKIHLELSDHLPEISADKVQLQQIIMNLVINAGESISETGTVVIRTGTTRMELENQNSTVNADLPLSGPAVFLEVRDSGTGMTSVELSRAFEPFFTTKFVGRGLGLSAVQGIVKGHNGRLVVNSTKGTGTTMRVILPIFQDNRHESVGMTPKKDLTWNSKILIVDDEEIVARTLHRYLDHMRIPAEYVLSGKECIARLADNPGDYDLVILDLTMAGMDGYETFKQLRRINPQLQVVLISGFTEKEATRNFAAHDLAGFLAKPISEKALMDLIRHLRI